MDLQEKIDLLSRRISELAQQQSTLSRQLLQMIDDLEALKKQAASSGAYQSTEVEAMPVKTVEYKEPIVAPSQKTSQPAYTPKPQQRSSFEEFIGKNVASKVGILVTIVGIFIGARYAIEHNLVSPAVRITSGYCSGIILIILAIFFEKEI